MTSAIITSTRRATPGGIAQAASILVHGDLVAFPTETVYGLGADAGNDRAVAMIFWAKGRPQFNPVIVHVADLAAGEAIAEFSPDARALAEKFWPGGLTLVLPRKPDAKISLLVSAGLDTVAIRVPANETAQALLRAAGRPIAAPSANASGTISATTAAHVAESLDHRVSLVLDGGPAKHGIESTVIGFSDGAPVMLRPGAIAREEIEAVVGPLHAAGDGLEGSPGRLAAHYAPATPLRLNAGEIRDGEVVLAFGKHVLRGAKEFRNLSPSSSMVEAAANLFAMLRELDALGAAGIAAMHVPSHGLGEAINDRLARAAMGRT
ncbi:MAG TPA: L-threonylcarbamoyladenylate synthase [Rhizomicrobium sp.]|jgi:L-threonylcarbamoyladenylate synthase